MKFDGCRIVIIFIALLLLVIDFPNQYKTIHCKSKNGILFTKIHWKILINLLIDSQNHFTGVKIIPRLNFNDISKYEKSSHIINWNISKHS